jgi:hypothetical protein
MEARTRPPIWLLPQAAKEPIPELTTRQPALAGVLSAIALLALVPMFVFVAPESTWAPQSLSMILLSLGFISTAAAVRVRRSTSLDAGPCVALVTIVLLGPLPGACIYAAGEMVAIFEPYKSGRRLITLMGNLAMFGWAALAAGFVLSALVGHSPVGAPDGPLAYGAIVVAGVAMALVMCALYPIVASLYIGIRLQTVTRNELIPSLIGDTMLIPLALLSVALYDLLGLVGLIPLASIAVAPRLIAPLAMHRVDTSRISTGEAAALYTSVLAEMLGMDRASRRRLSDAAHHLDGPAQLQRVEDFEGVMQAVLYARERFDGSDGGFPGILSGKGIPLESRVLAVAHAWALLTAADTQELAPEQAVGSLRAGAGTEFDPEVVAAAVKAVEDDVLHEPIEEGPTVSPVLSA